MLEKLAKSPRLRAFLEEIAKPSASLLIEDLWESPKAICLLLLLQIAKKNICLVASPKTDRLSESFSFFAKSEILDLPPRESISSEEETPLRDIDGKRIQTLYATAARHSPVIVKTSLQALLQPVPDPDWLLSRCKTVRTGEKTELQELISLLETLGYIRSALATDKGEFAVRGGIVDIFPTASFTPYRLDFFGDTIETIRTYDPVGQRSTGRVKELFLCPASEPEGESQYLNRYFGPDTVMVFDDPFASEEETVIFESIGSRRKHRSLQELLSDSENLTKLFFVDRPIEELSSVGKTSRPGRGFYSGKNPFQDLSFECFHTEFCTRRFAHPFVRVGEYFAGFANQESADRDTILLGLSRGLPPETEVRIVTSSPAEKNLLIETAEALQAPFPPEAIFEEGYLPSGFVIEDPKLLYLAAPELTHRYRIRRQKWRESAHVSSPSDFQRPNQGDIVVHSLHGIGRFLGMEIQKNHLGQEAEFFRISYAEGGELYVPAAQSHLITPYIGSGETVPTFSVLGAKRWQKTYGAAQTSILGYAKQLLDTAAQRTTVSGVPFPPDSSYQKAFEEEFPFPATEDQLRAVSEIKRDMESAKPMDRLLCGDVGYGKTEVALRAAFKAAFDGKKQVAILVPTTLLAMQHYETFVDRMANFPLRIALLSRLSSPKELKRILKGLQDHTIDIVIGTHKLLGKDVAFADLGLLIVDEEQRFGVKAKEHIKQIKSGLGCLTLSATPIPRTLYLSLVGMREISIIATPPQDRLPVKSILVEKTAEIVKEGILRELSRGGQVFFLHNRVETLPLIREELQKLVPAARIVHGHGQMAAEEIDAVFSSFRSGNADILLATTLIENGIDVPNANTIFIDRADTFGMADLYQMRGRVGRRDTTAYAYFLIPPRKSLSELAYKRLRAILESSGFGGGMKIAMRDLELRGAGDILGTRQSGQISAVGFHLYCKMLKKAVRALKESKPLEMQETKVDFSHDARLPFDYVNDPSLRMEFYYRFGNADSPAEIEELTEELKDRFGPLPKEAILLAIFSKIKILASSRQIASLKVEKLTVTAEKLVSNKLIRETFRIPPPFPDTERFEKAISDILLSWQPKP